jgi:hypothetical protein
VMCYFHVLKCEMQLLVPSECQMALERRFQDEVSARPDFRLTLMATHLNVTSLPSVTMTLKTAAGKTWAADTGLTLWNVACDTAPAKCTSSHLLLLLFR